MGNLARVDPAALKHRFGLRHFVETGAGMGHGIAHALTLGFEQVYSCEIDATLADACAVRFRNEDRVTLVRQDSATFLKEMVHRIPLTHPTLFWLDAHFPGADYLGHSFTDEPDPKIRLPMEEELRTLGAWRLLGTDVIVADDARIWLDGPFANGNLPENVRTACPQERGIGFVDAIMGRTHHVRVRYEDEGYVVMTPRRPL